MMPTGDEAQILDRGYRRYDGPRLGVSSAFATTTKHSIQRVLGIKRTIWQKIIPAFTILLAWIPAIVFVGLALWLDIDVIEDEVLPTYSEYYGFIVSGIFLFAGFSMPEVLCTDRRTGMIGLYLASPLDRNSYLAAKATSVVAVMGIVTIGPVLLLLAAYSIEGSGPDGIGNWFLTFGRILLAGVAVSFLISLFALMVSSFTDRRAVASASILIGLIAIGAVIEALVEGADWNAHLYLLDIVFLSFMVVERIYGVAPDEFELRDVATLSQVGAYVGWCLVFAGVTIWRYRKITVSR